MAITLLKNGEYRIWDKSMKPYQKAFRGQVTDLHELDTHYAPKGIGATGISALDDTFTRQTFTGFYKDCLQGLQTLEQAVNKALALEDIYKPEERQKRQLAGITPPLQNLLKAMFTHLQRIKADKVRAEQLIQEATLYETTAKAEGFVIEELRAQEIRAAFRGMDEENRVSILKEKVLQKGDLFTLQAIENDPLGLVRPDILTHIKADFIQARAKWLFERLDDESHLLKQLQLRCQLVQGQAFSIIKKGGAIQLPEVAPWNDGRYFVENEDGYQLRLPVIPEGYPGATVPLPQWHADYSSYFAHKMAV